MLPEVGGECAEGGDGVRAAGERACDTEEGTRPDDRVRDPTELGVVRELVEGGLVGAESALGLRDTAAACDRTGERSEREAKVSTRLGS